MTAPREPPAPTTQVTVGVPAFGSAPPILSTTVILNDPGGDGQPTTLAIDTPVVQTNVPFVSGGGGGSQGSSTQSLTPTLPPQPPTPPTDPKSTPSNGNNNPPPTSGVSPLGLGLGVGGALLGVLCVVAVVGWMLFVKAKQRKTDGEGRTRRKLGELRKEGGGERKGEKGMPPPLVLAVNGWGKSNREEKKDVGGEKDGKENASTDTLLLQPPSEFQTSTGTLGPISLPLQDKSGNNPAGYGTYNPYDYYAYQNYQPQQTSKENTTPSSSNAEEAKRWSSSQVSESSGSIGTPQTDGAYEKHLKEYYERWYNNSNTYVPSSSSSTPAERRLYTPPQPVTTTTNPTTHPYYFSSFTLTPLSFTTTPPPSSTASDTSAGAYLPTSPLKQGETYRTPSGPILLSGKDGIPTSPLTQGEVYRTPSGCSLEGGAGGKKRSSLEVYEEGGDGEEGGGRKRRSLEG
ncbi:hypothetical protein HDV05_001279 [Chytridiales sp. JEL 0842]|nr:hypothetical protein HDV05_001279 [Chytridiales sp. JEL 0842]